MNLDDTIKLYHISLVNLGERGILSPRVPKTTMKTKDKETKRVSTSRTILGCMKGIIFPAATAGNTYNSTAEINNKRIDSVKTLAYGGIVQFYLYSAEVKIKDIIVPNKQQLPDWFLSGELWVTAEYEWQREHIIGIRMVKDLGCSGHDIWNKDLFLFWLGEFNVGVLDGSDTCCNYYDNEDVRWYYSTCELYNRSYYGNDECRFSFVEGISWGWEAEKYRMMGLVDENGDLGKRGSKMVDLDWWNLWVEGERVNDNE